MYDSLTHSLLKLKFQNNNYQPLSQPHSMSDSNPFSPGILPLPCADQLLSFFVQHFYLCPFLLHNYLACSLLSIDLAYLQFGCIREDVCKMVDWSITVEVQTALKTKNLDLVAKFGSLGNRGEKVLWGFARQLAIKHIQLFKSFLLKKKSL